MAKAEPKITSNFTTACLLCGAPAVCNDLDANVQCSKCKAKSPLDRYWAKSVWTGPEWTPMPEATESFDEFVDDVLHRQRKQP